MTDRKMVYVDISDEQKVRMDALKKEGGITIQFITDKVFTTDKSLDKVLADLEESFGIKREGVE